MHDQPPLTEDPTTIPPPPRTVDRRIARQIWLEPRVRFWWIASAVMLIIGAGFFVGGVHARSHQWQLIREGVKVDAKIVATATETLPNRRQPPDSIVTLEFPWEGKPFNPPPRPLENRKGQVITTGAILPLHVNPNDPTDWTWLDEPVPFLTQIVGGLIALPISVVALLWALVRRARIRSIWKSGDAVGAIVLETRITAVAPLSRAVRVTPEDEANNRIYTVYLPPRYAGLQRGDLLPVLLSPNRKTAIGAGWLLSHA